MNLRVTLSQNVVEELRRTALGLGPARRKELLTALAADLRADIVRHITTVKVPAQSAGITWWQQAAATLRTTVTDREAVIAFTRPGIRLHYYGGEVRPRKARALAIPTKDVPIKNGTRLPPRAAGLLAFIPAAKGRETLGYLVTGRRKTITRGKRKGGTRLEPIPRTAGGHLLYILRTVTRHRADPSFLPTDQRVAQLLTASAKRFLKT